MNQSNNFFETYIIPSTASWINAYVNVTVNAVTETIYFNVTGGTASGKTSICDM